eukprot:998942_1
MENLVNWSSDDLSNWLCSRPGLDVFGIATRRRRISGKRLVEELGFEFLADIGSNEQRSDLLTCLMDEVVKVRISNIDVGDDRALKDVLLNLQLLPTSSGQVQFLRYLVNHHQNHYLFNKPDRPIVDRDAHFKNIFELLDQSKHHASCMWCFVGTKGCGKSTMLQHLIYRIQHCDKRTVPGNFTNEHHPVRAYLQRTIVIVVDFKTMKLTNDRDFALFLLHRLLLPMMSMEIISELFARFLAVEHPAAGVLNMFVQLLENLGSDLPSGFLIVVDNLDCLPSEQQFEILKMCISVRRILTLNQMMLVLSA